MRRSVDVSEVTNNIDWTIGILKADILNDKKPGGRMVPVLLRIVKVVDQATEQTLELGNLRDARWLIVEES